MGQPRRRPGCTGLCFAARGSIFQIPPPDPVNETSLSESRKPIRVLFVEDAFDQALLVKAFLSDAGGYEVVHSQDGDHAVSLLRSEPWGLLIADLNLPGTDGFEVIRVVKEVDPSMPALATTGYTGAAYHEQAFRAGANDLLVKPLQKDDFLAKIAELCGDQRVVPQKGAILAVGGLVGDVEMGCGGTLIAARQGGREVVILPLCHDDGAELSVIRSAAQRAAGLLELRLVFDPGAMEDTGRRVALLGETVRDLNPATVFVPAMDETHAARMEAFRIAKAATANVPEVVGYQTGTTGMDFRPSRFNEIGRNMVLKMEALAAYQSAGAGRLDLGPRMAQAYARYWGRYQGFTEVEAFEVLRSAS